MPTAETAVCKLTVIHHSVAQLSPLTLSACYYLYHSGCAGWTAELPLLQQLPALLQMQGRGPHLGHSDVHYDRSVLLSRTQCSVLHA
jgi:hypothetical protein